MVDSSTSVSKENFRKVLEFLKHFLSEADIDSGSVRVGLAIYGTSVYIQFNLNDFTTKEEIFEAIDKVRYRHGSTNIAHAFRTMRTRMFTEENGDRPDVRNIALLVTDGVSNIEHYETIPQARLTQADDIHVYVIGIGLTDTTELQRLSSKPAKENTFVLQDFDELEALKDKVFEKFYPVIITTEPPTEPPVEPPTPPPTTPVPTTACRASLADVVLVLDSSTSVSAQNFQKMLTFAKEFLSDAGIDSGGVRVGILIYSTHVHIQFHLNKYKTKREIFAAIDAIEYRYGDTNTAAALRMLRTTMFTPENGDREEAPNVALVLTDGVSNIESSRTVIESSRAQSAGIHIYAVGIGLIDSDLSELKKIASHPTAENSFSVEDFDQLDKKKEEVFAQFCPEPPTTPPEPECVAASTDVVFLLDTSTSVIEANFRKVLTFVKDFLSEANFGHDGIRVGVVTYSTNVNVQFYLNSYETKDEIFAAIDKVPYTYGSTNTAGGLETLRKVMFTKNRGDREKARNIAIVVTDGVSNVNAYRTLDEAALVKASDIHISAIGVGLVEVTELHRIVSNPPEDNTFLAQNFDELQGLKKLVFAEMCPEPTTTPVITTTEKCSAATSDLAFLLDSSTSVSETNFKKVLTFVKEFLSTAYIAPDGVHISVVTYSTEVHIEFPLNKYMTREEIYEAIDRIPYRYGSTNTADGLKTIRTQIFSVESGDRLEAPNRMFVVTDGVSNINHFRTLDEAKLAKNQDIHIYAIGIGLPDTKELMKIASEPPEANTFIVKEFSDLKGLQAQVFKEFCPVITTPKPTEPTTEACSVTGSDVVFLLDSSTSVSERNFKKVLEFVKEFLSDAYIASNGVRVGLITFSSYVNVHFELNKYTTAEEVFAAIDMVPYRYGSTNTADGLRALRKAFSKKNGDRLEAPNYALVVTDGVSNINAFQTVREAELTKAQGIHIYAIGVGLTETAELEKIASLPSRENTFNVQDFTELQGIKKDVFQQFCPGMPTPKPKTTTTTVPPTTMKPLLSLRGKCRAAKTDIVFVLDSSTSVSERNFDKMLRFVKEFLSEAPIGPKAVRVGVIVYSTSVSIQFHLNEFHNKEDVFAAVDRIQYTYGSTNTAGALKVMRTTMFNKQNGDREDAHNIAVVVTDGVSNINSYQITAEAERAKKEDIHIYAIGVGLSESRELSSIASSPAKENMYQVQDFDELRGLRAKVFKEFCPETCISSSVDIVFLLDTSTSVEERNFKKMITFVKDLLSNATIDSGIVRVGVATYSTRVNIEFNLNDFSTKADIYKALNKIRFRYGNTNTAGALHTMRTRMFTSAHGDRENSIDVAILMTDGVSNINTHRINIEAEAARDRGIQVYAIGIGLAETSELIKITSQPAEDYTLSVQNFRELQGLKGRLFDFCDHGL